VPSVVSSIIRVTHLMVHITDASHDLIISVGNNIMYLFIVH
jgi:hypothetical protein